MNGPVGIGFRKDFAEEFLAGDALRPAFVEVAPENWVNIGGYWRRVLRQVAERYPITAHGLSLSLGSPEELDWDLLRAIKAFLDEFRVPFYTEHLSFAKCGNAHLYDLLPIPFRADAVRHVADRIRRVQDFLERPLLIENVSYYTPVAAELDEATFIRAVLEEADCGLLLDVNNVFVNAFNHQYDAGDFLRRLPLERVGYIHMAGHEQVSPELIIDTHGQPIVAPVYELFEETLPLLRPVLVLLERDFNIPDLAELQHEVDVLRLTCQRHWPHADVFADHFAVAH